MEYIISDSAGIDGEFPKECTDLKAIRDFLKNPYQYWERNGGDSAIDVTGRDSFGRTLIFFKTPKGIYITDHDACLAPLIKKNQAANVVTHYVGGEPMDVPDICLCDEEVAFKILSFFIESKGELLPDYEWVDIYDYIKDKYEEEYWAQITREASENPVGLQIDEFDDYVVELRNAGVTNTDKYADPTLDLEQATLSKQLNFNAADLYKPGPNDIVATADVHYENEFAFVAFDISYSTGEHIDYFISKEEVEGKYTPGYFSFYEGPPLVAAFQKLLKTGVSPNVIIVDGHGIAHPRKFGLACYVGAATQLPVIGVAKKPLLKFEGQETFLKGEVVEIKLRDEVVGCAYGTKANVKPIFISVGNKIDLATSIEIIERFIETSRLPENVKRADRKAREFARENKK